MTRRKPIDLAMVREARRNLDRLVREHPELLARADALRDDFAEIMTPTPGGKNMATQPSQYRLDPELLERIDRHAERMSRIAVAAGLPSKITRTAALRVLLLDALDRAEAADKPKRSRKRR